VVANKPGTHLRDILDVLLHGANTTEHTAPKGQVIRPVLPHVRLGDYLLGRINATLLAFDNPVVIRF